MSDVFPIVPAESRFVWWLVVIVVVVLITVTAIMIKTATGSLSSSFEVSSAGLRVRGDLYGRLIPASVLRGGSARVIDLRVKPELMPARRRFGTAVPGYRAGWFRLRNGEKSLLYLTDTNRAVYVPTNAGYSLLLSAQNPEQFVARLRAVAPQS